MHWPELFSHLWPESQRMHSAPLAPHSLSDSLERATHAPLSQQPEHAAPPQVQAPPEHA